MMVRQVSCRAGLRPRITAQTAGMMSVNIILDSDSSSSDEEEPTPVTRHKGVFCLRSCRFQHCVATRVSTHSA